MLFSDTSASSPHPVLSPPVVIVAERGWYNDPQKRWQGTVQTPDAVEVIVTVNGGNPLRVPVINGHFEWMPPQPMADGEYQLTFTAVDAAGNHSAPTRVDYNIDTHPPARPIIEAIEDHVAGGVEDGNSIRRNGYTNDDQPVVRGQAEANALVYLYNDNQLLASVRADAQGNWQAQLDLPQDGTYNLTAQAEDRADNRSQPSPKWTFHLDTLTPETPTFSYYDDNRGLYQGQFGRGQPTDDVRPELHGEAEPGSVVRIQYAAPGGKWIVGGTATVDSSGHWRWTPPQDLLPDGDWRFRSRSSDKAGNVSQWSDSWTLTIDTRINTPTILQAIDDVGTIQPVLPGQTTDDKRLDFSGQAEPYSQVTLYQNGVAAGSATVGANGRWQITPDRDMQPGSNNFTVKAVDVAGNISNYAPNWAINYDSGVKHSSGEENWNCRANTSWQTGRVYQYGGLKVTELKHGTSNNCFYTGIMNRPDGYESKAIEMLDHSIVQFDFGATNYVEFNYGYLHNCDTYVDIFSPSGELLGREYLQPGGASRSEQGLNTFSWQAPAGQQIGYIDVHSGEDPDTYKKVLCWNVLVKRDVGWIIDTVRWGKDESLVQHHTLPETQEQEGAQLHLNDVQQWLAAHSGQLLQGFSALVLEGEHQQLDYQQLTQHISGLQHIDLTGSGDNLLQLDAQQLLQQAHQDVLLPERTRSWLIDGDAGDVVQLSDSTQFYQQWQQQGTQQSGGKVWQVFESVDHSATLLINNEVMVA